MANPGSGRERLALGRAGSLRWVALGRTIRAALRD